MLSIKYAYVRRHQLENGNRSIVGKSLAAPIVGAIGIRRYGGWGQARDAGFRCLQLILRAKPYRCAGSGKQAIRCRCRAGGGGLQQRFGV